jgi:multidrug resistance efflux pump
MQASLLMLGTLLAVAGTPPAGSTAEIKLDKCLVSLTDQRESQVSSKEAGILKQMLVRAGQEINENEPLAQLDDAEAKLASIAADAEYKVALEEARSDVNVRYSKAAARVAYAELIQAQESNRRVPGSVAKSEISRLELTYERSLLEIEKAQMDSKIAGLKAEVAKAKADATREKLTSRKIVSPLEGIVVELRKRPGEWVQPGDVLLYMLRSDRLKVEGFIKSSDHAPREIAGCPVTVSVPLVGGKPETLTGRIVFVSPRAESGGEYRVWAEVDNRKRDGHWVVQPGLTATMVIQPSN